MHVFTCINPILYVYVEAKPFLLRESIYIDRFAKNVINDTRQEEVRSFFSCRVDFESDKLEFNE